MNTVNLFIECWHGDFDFEVVPFRTVAKADCRYIGDVEENGNRWSCYEENGYEPRLFAVRAEDMPR